MSNAYLLGLLLLATRLSGIAVGLVPDPQIMTDHEVYRGELSCSTLDRNIADAYRIYKDRYGHEPKTDTEKLIALWIWKLEHYMHVCDNIVYIGPGSPEAMSNGWMDCRDSQMGQFSFGFGLCYSVHAQMCPLVSRALGNDQARVRCPTVPGHTPFEAYVDGRWVLADFTASAMVFGDDGKPVGLAEIVPYEQDHAWRNDPKRCGPLNVYLGRNGHQVGGYQELLSNQMLFGYNAMPIVYSLRPGETFTRYLEPGLEDGKTWVFWGRDYYNILGKPKHGAFRNQTFLDDYPVGNGNKGMGNSYYGNGIFEYTPPLAGGRYREGLASETATTFADGLLRGTSAEAHITFQHVTPYIIGARSSEGGDREWNLLEEKCVDGAIASGQTLGKVPVKVSVDAGQTWQQAGVAQGQFKIDFTDIVKGRHFYLIRFDLPLQAGLKNLRLRTVTQISRAVFPRLTDGGTKITYESSGQSVIHGGPSQYLAEQYRRKDLEKDGFRVYEVKAPSAIQFASGALRATGPAMGPWSVEFSLDGGKTWKHGFDPITLKPGQSDWADGRHAYAWAEMDFPGNKNARSVFIRFGKGDILHCQVFATCQSPSTSGFEVTYNWLEGDKPKEHSHLIAPGKVSDSWTVPTTKGVKTKWVRFAAR